MSYLFVIEGLIGAGKTTLATELGHKLNSRVILEPVDDNIYLKSFYEDPDKYAFPMQFWLMSKRFQMHTDAIRHIISTGQSVIMDRSIYGDKAFCKLNYLSGKIDEMGYHNYLQMRSAMERFLLYPSICLYLNTNPEKCAERIGTRGRDCEKGIPVSYLAGLDDIYKKEILPQMEEHGTKIINVDWDEFKPTSYIVDKISPYLTHHKYVIFPKIQKDPFELTYGYTC